MCMRTCDFSLQWDSEEKAFVGYGWKKLNSTTIKELGRNWNSARFTMHGGPAQSKDTTVGSLEGGRYPAGFHIFLNKDDAINYDCEEDQRVVKVKFKNVLAYGTNDTYSANPGECIIANNMKVVQRWSHDGTKKLRML